MRVMMLAAATSAQRGALLFSDDLSLASFLALVKAKY
jgi:hypothetical protein